MTAVDRPDNGQDERDRAFADWYAEPRGQMSYPIAFAAGWDAASGRAGAGEQQREQVARWCYEQVAWTEGDPPNPWEQLPEIARQGWRTQWADELLALLGGPQPDGEVRQHRMDADCWCGPVQADNGAWDHQ